MMPAPSPALTWPDDHEAVRFVILTEADRYGLRRIRSLVWVEGRKHMIERRANLDVLLASARRRSVVFDVVDASAEPETEAA